MEPEEGLNQQQSPRVKLSRRSFLALAGAVALSVPLMKAEAVAAKAAGKKPIKPKHYVTPPGIKTRKHFHEHCTGCHLCVSKCPQKVLRPATTQYGLAYAMQPVKDYDASYCRAGCTRCTNVCPSGALRPLTRDQKLHSPVGYAVAVHENCMGCGECASVCPQKAITMNKEWLPVVNHILCIGCGACQYACPARPVKAIYVEGI